MAEVSIKTTPAAGTPTVRRGLSVATALLIAVTGAAVAIVATIVVLRNEYSTRTEAVVAALALLAFGITAYGLLQAVLAVIDSAGERRRQERTVSERRQGDRARQPRQP